MSALSDFFMKDTDIRNNITSFYDPIEMPGGWTFDHVKQIETNELYYRGKYKTGQYDSQGFRKFFYNIIKPSCDLAHKFVDLDVKDIQIIPLRDGDEMPVFFMQRRLRQYLLEHQFGKLLNEIAAAFPKEHVILKKVGTKFHFVNVENIRTDTTAQYLKDSDFVYEIHEMSKGEIQDKGYDAEELFNRYPTQQKFTIYECYHKNGKKWDRSIKADLFGRLHDSGFKSGTEALLGKNQVDFVGAICLDEDTVDRLPYRELKWEDVKGRWLAYTYPELLEDNQIATNEAENLERKGLMFTSLKLYQTRDDTIGGSNVLTNAENGDILKVNHEISPIPMEERNLAAFNSTRGRWDQNTERKTFSFDIARGENLPSRTPVGVANLSAAMVTSYFELKRQNFGLFIQDLVINDIIPDFRKDTAKEHTMMIAGSDEEISRLDSFIAESLVTEASNKYAMETGFSPLPEMKEAAKMKVTKQLKSKVNRYVKIMKDYFVNAKYIVEINVVGESFNLNKNNEALNFAMQMMNNNPQVLQNSVTRTLLFTMLESNGISPAKLRMLEAEAQQPQPEMQQGGSMAKSLPSQGGMGQSVETFA
jgi:hypothetical protein